MGIANSTIHPLFELSVLNVLLCSSVGFHKFENPTSSQNHPNTHQLNSVCATKKINSKDSQKDLSKKSDWSMVSWSISLVSRLGLWNY
jgi:hypothetical protein